MMKENNNLMTAKILNLVADAVADKDEAEWKNAYRLSALWDMSDNQHARYTGKAVNLAKRMLKYGGDSNEMWRVLNYIWICINAKKCKLDIIQAARDFRIIDLNDKYRDHSDEEPTEEPEEGA